MVEHEPAPHAAVLPDEDELQAALDVAAWLVRLLDDFGSRITSVGGRHHGISPRSLAAIHDPNPSFMESRPRASRSCSFWAFLSVRSTSTRRTATPANDRKRRRQLGRYR